MSTPYASGDILDPWDTLPVDVPQTYRENPRQFSSTDLSDPWITPTTNEPVAKPLATPPTSETKSPGFTAALKSVQQWQAERTEISPIELQSYRDSNRRSLEGLPPSPQQLANIPLDAGLSAQRPSAVSTQQSLPSTGSPPPTINESAARPSAIVEPTATPVSGNPRQAIGASVAVGGLLASLPRSLPQAAGRLAVPGVFGAVDLANRVISGQPIAQAASGVLATSIGSGIGFTIGAATGVPLLAYAGAAIGGIAGSRFSDWLFSQNIPTTTARQEEYTPNYVDTRKGQTTGVLYRVTFSWDRYFQGNFIETLLFNATAQGPIKAIALGVIVSQGSVGAYTIGTNSDGSDQVLSNGYGYVPASGAKNLSNLSVVRVDGNPEIYPDTTPPATGFDNKPYYYGTSPLGNDATIPSGKPAAGQNKGKADYVPSSMPANNTPNGGGAFPGHGGLAPSYLPNPEHIPSNGGGMLPEYAPQRSPTPSLEPQNTVIPGASNAGIGAGANYTVITGNPSISTIKDGVVTSPRTENVKSIPVGFSSTPSPSTQRASPVPDAYSPVPKLRSQPMPKTSEEAETDKTTELIKQQKKDFDDQIGRLTAITTAIAAITPAIQGIPDAIANSPTVQAANRNTVQGAVCEIAQPGRCLGNALEDSTNNINQNNNQNTSNLLDKINAGASAAQLALLELMNRKLGDLIPGGLSGKLQRLSSWLHLDRALNILIWWQTLHNAYMLSANLGQTLTSAISNVLAAIGIKDAEGSPLDIGEILGHQFDSLAKSVIGESEWGGIKAEYKKWNRIYQAAANLMNSIQSIGYSILSALEVVGSWVAVIGNGLRKWGEVGESAYRWMNPTPNFQNKFFTALETTENVVSQIDTVASEVLSVQETVTQIGTQKTEFLKALGEEPNSKQGITPPEASKIKASSAASRVVSATGIAISDSDKEADD